MLGSSQNTDQSDTQNLGSSDEFVTKTVTQGAGHEIVMEHNYAEYPSSSNMESFEDQEPQNETPLNEQFHDNAENDGITIKLKYINDDLKLVDGKLDELLGDFKK